MNVPSSIKTSVTVRRVHSFNILKTTKHSYLLTHLGATGGSVVAALMGT